MTSGSARSAFDAALDAARAAFPEVGVPFEAFRAYVLARLPSEDAAELSRRHCTDLLVACGCECGDPAALALIERTILPKVERALARVAKNPDERRELMQALRLRMLVRDEGTTGISTYDGRAPLDVWLRVCVTRMGLTQLARGQRQTQLDDDQLADLAPGVPSPELDYMRRHYGAQFQLAFAQALADLPARARNLLRHGILDGLSIDQIAAIYHVHRATAARQLRDARLELVAGTRRALQNTLGVGEAELESIMRVLMSQAALTLRTALRGTPRDLPP